MIKSRDAYEQGEITMDLLKMHPMARKMNVHNEAFAKALEANEPEAARMHLSEIKKLSSYLEEDLVFAIRKAEVAASDPLTVFANGVPTASYSDSGSGFDPVQSCQPETHECRKPEAHSVDMLDRVSETDG